MKPSSVVYTSRNVNITLMSTSDGTCSVNHYSIMLQYNWTQRIHNISLRFVLILYNSFAHAVYLQTLT